MWTERCGRSDVDLCATHKKQKHFGRLAVSSGRAPSAFLPVTSSITAAFRRPPQTTEDRREGLFSELSTTSEATWFSVAEGAFRGQAGCFVEQQEAGERASLEGQPTARARVRASKTAAQVMFRVARRSTVSSGVSRTPDGATGGPEDNAALSAGGRASGALAALCGARPALLVGAEISNRA
ncbi:hypothetical protein MRX96_033135 [Rhipicephalus microplus]